jgi:hypothetical protein
MKTIYFKNFFIILLFIYFVVGAYYSLNTGLSFDEWVEQIIWDYNVAIFKNSLFAIDIDKSFNYFPHKYYGIGFQIISQPIQLLLADLITNFQNINSYGAHLISKHFVVFIFFFISGIFFHLIIKKINKNILFNYTATFLYLLYPYLFGHSLFNPKDIPFLSLWVICTYFSIDIFIKLTKELYLKNIDVILISFLTAFLLSIRISGVLIFIQYIFTLIIFLNLEKMTLKHLLKKMYKHIFSFILLVLTVTYLLYPAFWKNPLMFIEAINEMSNYINNVCTLTLGKCMFSNKLDPTYIPIWLSVKLPLIILIGILLLPLTEKKIFNGKAEKLTFGTLLLSIFVIPIILILKKVHLYDEIRQIMFLIPLIFIVGLVSLFIFSKKLFYTLAFLTISLFVVENIKIYPSQYVWFNTPSRFLNLSKNFELDYWGLSSRDLAENIVSQNISKSSKPCILTNPPWMIDSFLDNNSFLCFGLWGEIDSDFERPFWAVQNMRNLKKGKSYKCDSVYESKFNFLFSKEEIITGRLLKCI